MFKNFKVQFGGKIRPQDIQKYEQSTQWNGKIFENLSETIMDVNIQTMPKLLKKQFTDTKSRSPRTPLPVQSFNPEKWNKEPEIPKFIWYGHSVLLLQLNGKTLLIDPMFGSDAAPIAPFKVKRFSKNTLNLIDDLPPIDAILLTHDHYDHLDYDSILKLKGKVDTWLVALGVSRHLEKWGISTNQITEFDWWNDTVFNDIKITFTPSRHFSGRGMRDRAKSLWGGWVFETDQHKIYWSGDSGYDTHFKTIGEKFGEFDWAFMECGQYNEHWHAIHMYPEETVQASIESKAKVSIPVHWGGFPLSLHSWKEPIERFVAEAEKKKTHFYTPKIGEIVTLSDEVKTNKWWEDFE
ncbi:MAG: MBL fold metallo-hydrolase [Flavobacteriales bacterium]|nr:MBL fold metallo-hydrolase [Flavobacteriales bacterium]MCB9335315.1 MBL fold metallo-hydrolase [Flavobacteriales bacterium]